MVLALNPGPHFTAITGNPAGLLFWRIWYSVGKSGVLGITEYRQGRPLHIINMSKQRVVTWIVNGTRCGMIDMYKRWASPSLDQTIYVKA